MTLRRQQRKEYGAAVALLFAILAMAPGGAGAQSLSDRIVVNRFTGLAISGFDPVAYFTEARPVRGIEQFETIQGGATWRFRNEGNRAAFINHPEIYGPQFGGYDPVDVARGRIVAGSSDTWAIHNKRLMLFSSETSLQAFSADPEGFFASAQKRWPMLKDELSQ
jgi:YHS domain-containing protein